jgi:hypothetical protein
LDVEFIHVNQKLFWGFERIWVSSWHQINITDPERTAPAAIEILEDAWDKFR